MFEPAKAWFKKIDTIQKKSSVPAGELFQLRLDVFAALFLLEATEAEIKNLNNELRRFFEASPTAQVTMAANLARERVEALRLQGITSLNAVAFIDRRLAEFEQRFPHRRLRAR